MQIIYSFLVVLLIIFIVPVLVYGLAAAFLGLKEPAQKLGFFMGVLIQKIGTATGFIALLYLGREFFVTNWLLYSLVWFGMYALTEVGQVLMSEYSWKEAGAGIISEAVYFPLAALAATNIIR